MLLVSELIKELHDILEEHGDIDIRIINSEGEAEQIEDIGLFEDFHPVNKEIYVYLSS